MAIIDKRIPESRPTVSQKPLAHFFSFISNTGIAAILLGGAGMITSPEYFWFEVVLVNFGLILLAIQAYREQWQEALVRWLLVCTTLAATIGFNWFWVFVDLPLEVSSIIIDA